MDFTIKLKAKDRERNHKDIHIDILGDKTNYGGMLILSTPEGYSYIIKRSDFKTVMNVLETIERGEKL